MVNFWLFPISSVGKVVSDSFLSGSFQLLSKYKGLEYLGHFGPRELSGIFQRCPMYSHASSLSTTIWCVKMRLYWETLVLGLRCVRLRTYTTVAFCLKLTKKTVIFVLGRSTFMTKINGRIMPVLPFCFCTHKVSGVFHFFLRQKDVRGFPTLLYTKTAFKSRKKSAKTFYKS